MRCDLHRYWVRKSKVLYSFDYIGMLIRCREWMHYFTSIEDMMKKSVIKGTLVTLMLAASQQASASTILVETGYSIFAIWPRSMIRPTLAPIVAKTIKNLNKIK